MRLSATRIQLLVLLGLLVLPFLISSDFYMDVLILILIWAAAAGSWNIVGGFGGLFSLGHAAYFGVGAYTSTLLFINFGLSPWLGMLLGAILSALLGLIIGVLTLRLRGPFFVMASIGFLEVLRIGAINWASLTKGSGGLSVPFEPSLLNMSFYSRGPYFYIALFVALLPYLFALYMKRSKLGYQMVAVREDEAAAEAAGVDAVRVKLTVTVVSTFLTALAGTVYAQYIGFIDPIEVFSLHLSIELALMAIVGGMALASGPVVGAALITLLSVAMSGLLGGQGAGLYLVVNGLLLLLVILFIPQGIVPWISEKIRSGRMPGRKRVKVLELREVSKSFGGLKAVDGVSMRIESEDIYGVIGPNGAGKTTLFDVITGFYKPSAGSVLFDGNETTDRKPHRNCHAGMARTFQVVKPFGGMTVLENVVVGAFARSNRVDEAEAVAAEILEKVGLEEHREARASTLPIGLKKRLELARALATGPKIVFLDEIMGGLTLPEVNEASELIRRLRQEGLTVCMIEHVMSAVMSLCDKVAVIHHGVKIADGTPDEVTRDPAVIEAYLGEDFSLA